MKPNPPIWIRIMTINWPANVNSVPIPLTKLFKPVTQVALVAKNKQSKKLPKLLACLQNGNIKRMAPIKMKTTKDMITSKYGLSAFFWVFITDSLYAFIKKIASLSSLLFFISYLARFDSF